MSGKWSWLILFFGLGLALSFAVLPAGAQQVTGPVNIAIPYVAGPGFTVAIPFSQGSVFMQAFNRSTLAQDYAGSLAVSFPALDGWNAGASPFAGPTIGQTVQQSLVAADTYFFNDFASAA